MIGNLYLVIEILKTRKLGYDGQNPEFIVN